MNGNDDSSNELKWVLFFGTTDVFDYTAGIYSQLLCADHSKPT